MNDNLIGAAAAFTLAAGWTVDHSILIRRLREARRCPVTGLPTRKLWTTQAHEQLRHRRADAVVLFIDLDRFKPVNDKRGHDAGDVVLTVQAERLTAWFAERGLFGRFGGDEFVGLVYPTTPAPDALRTEDALCTDLRGLAEHLAEPISLPEGDPVVVPASIGAARYAEIKSATLSRAQYAADGAMYAAKKAGIGWSIILPGQDDRINPDPAPRQRHHGPAVTAWPCPRCSYPSHYAVAAGIEVSLICGYCGNTYLSGDGFLGASSGAGESGRGRVDHMQFQTIEKEAATQ